MATFCQLRFVALLSRVSFFLWLYNLAWGKFSALCCATHKGESRGGERVQGEGVEMLTTTLTFAVRVALCLSLSLSVFVFVFVYLLCLPSWNYLSAKATRRVNGKHSRCRGGAGRVARLMCRKLLHRLMSMH